MPTYQYRCQACQHELEAFQKFTDDPLTTCEECGGKLRKLYNAVGIVFKGSGFYATDSRKSASAASPAKDAGKDAASSPTETAKPAAEASKPASKDGAAA